MLSSDAIKVSKIVSIFGQPKNSLISLLFSESTETSEQLLPDTVYCNI